MDSEDPSPMPHPTRQPWMSHLSSGSHFSSPSLSSFGKSSWCGFRKKTPQLHWPLLIQFKVKSPPDFCSAFSFPLLYLAGQEPTFGLPASHLQYSWTETHNHTDHDCNHGSVTVIPTPAPWRTAESSLIFQMVLNFTHPLQRLLHLLQVKNVFRITRVFIKAFRAN